jgi:hypothetical protein
MNRKPNLELPDFRASVPRSCDWDLDLNTRTKEIKSNQETLYTKQLKFDQE